MPHRAAAALLAAAAALSGCGTAATTASAPRARRPPPALASQPVRPGEILVRGATSPLTRGPFAFDGSYLVRFVQYEPLGGHVDFARQTAFVADLEHPGTPGEPAVRLFRTAAAGGRRLLPLHGRYLVDVSFGDFPFALRFTPTR
ncbi:MAG TPA: hypothetical protein VMT10_02440 [Solirubrobacteraceae bacterium]|nr:hypothetical protein [Solirubrobacteraceae bacterium]